MAGSDARGCGLERVPGGQQPAPDQQLQLAVSDQRHRPRPRCRLVAVERNLGESRVSCAPQESGITPGINISPAPGQPVRPPIAAGLLLCKALSPWARFVCSRFCSPLSWLARCTPCVGGACALLAAAVMDRVIIPAPPATAQESYQVHAVQRSPRLAQEQKASSCTLPCARHMLLITPRGEHLALPAQLLWLCCADSSHARSCRCGSPTSRRRSCSARGAPTSCAPARCCRSAAPFRAACRWGPCLLS